MTERITQKYKDGAYQYIKKQYLNGFFKKRYAVYCFSLIGIDEKEAEKIMAKWRKEMREKVRKLDEDKIRQRAEK